MFINHYLFLVLKTLEVGRLEDNNNLWRPISLIHCWSVQCISQSVVQSGHITVYIINIINCRDTNNANTYFTRYCTFLLLCMELRLVAFVCACTKQVAMRQLQPCRSYSIFFSRWPWLSLDWRSTWNCEINFTMKKEAHPWVVRAMS